MALRVLFIGGTGVISSACSRLAVEQGIDLTLFNRGQTQRRIPEGAHVLLGNIRDRKSAEQTLEGRTFDVVVDWLVFGPDQLEADLDLFQGRTGEYVLISSASAYQKPIAGLPITESTPLHNPYWAYSRGKIACEERLVRAYREEQFPITIVRPSHTYDRTMLPVHGRYTVIDRMRKGKKVIVHGDGTSLWVLTHQEDFAKAFVGLLGNPHAIGNAVQITSDEVLTWDQIHAILGQAAGAEPRITHVPSEGIARFDPEWGASLLGDKTHSVVFDNSKVKRLVPGFEATIPFSQGAREMIEWVDADPARQAVDSDLNALMDRIIAAYDGIGPG
jgi:nucleoside-diphosphate-sugar epimerase